MYVQMHMNVHRLGLPATLTLTLLTFARVEHGRLTSSRRWEGVVEELERGSCFGEQCLTRPDIRGNLATVRVCSEEATLLLFPAEQVKQLVYSQVRYENDFCIHIQLSALPNRSYACYQLWRWQEVSLFDLAPEVSHAARVDKWMVRFPFTRFKLHDIDRYYICT